MIKPKKEPDDELKKKCDEMTCGCGSGKKWKDCHGRSRIPC